ncbi:signal transduction histidine kinase, LytS [Methanococcus vannielii SB]|uniref:Signal transduction histidine kinase, LytS n=1 Tax=Methanococcus vannielii (strain ATCC 35089 / DSM 1224 / JCM 13029 / OCM 148 / SB) TaxID=406327 RepID=A6UNW7_METVS|nr:LytS/YhcK type 5TM receptor domain-containing protein [Methanococcus vannielii]ABR54189.1 signal transduction histidine kinase, LytS [Methanococcus vannielii SB]
MLRSRRPEEIKKEKMNVYAITFLLSILVNVIGGYSIYLFSLPAYLDTVGTILSGVLMGPVIGGVVGLISGLLLSVLVNPANLYFTPINILIGIVTGVIFRKYYFTLKNIILTAVLVIVFSVILGTLIEYFVFGGFAGKPLVMITEGLVSAGIDLIIAVKISNLFTNILDKFLSFAFVFLIISIMDNYEIIELFNLKIK